VKRVVFTDQARADVGRLDIPTAMRIFEALHRFADNGVGDVRKLRGDTEELRLRVGDYRVRLGDTNERLEVKRVLHRSQAYR
jgi:mRNA-degrading endonuclease RelE of RelBE toxin-antitoxin system